jgi:hypothetical protein
MKVFWNNFFVRLGDLKNESHFLKKAAFSSTIIFDEETCLDRNFSRSQT